MKITIEITKYRDMVTKAYRAGYSCGYKNGKKDGIQDILEKDISDIPFESDYPCIDDTSYLCELTNKEYVICKYKDGMFNKSDNQTKVRGKDIVKWKRI